MTVARLSMACVVTLTVSGPIGAQNKECAARVFVLQDLEKEPSVPSPDHRYRVVLGVRSEDDDHGWIRVYAGAELRDTYELHDLSGGVFVNWSPNSRAFYVMWSNGGAIGGYDVRAFQVGASHTTEAPLTKAVRHQFESNHPCPARGHNVYAVRWFKGSQQLLLALQVYPTSDCGREAGLYRGYLMNVADGMILREYSQPQLKSVWPAGCPSDIYPSGLWGSEDLKKVRKKN